MVLLKNSALMKRTELARELKEDALSEHYFLKVLRDFLEEALQKEGLLEQTAQENLGDLLLMSAIVHFQGVEQLFRLNIPPQQTPLDEQAYIRKARETPRDAAVAGIRKNLFGQ